MNKSVALKKIGKKPSQGILRNRYIRYIIRNIFRATQKKGGGTVAESGSRIASEDST
jgi:hypothetical protein